MSGPFVIVGGGPCGMAAAWHLARRGVRPVVLEAEDLVGGLCATHERNGWRFDLGGHRFVSSDAELSRWVERLLGDDLLEQERRSVVLHEGRTFRYPLEAADLVRNLGTRENLQALLGYARTRLGRERPTAEGSFEHWVVSRFGRPLYDRFFGPYTQKLWGIHPSLISADWAQERISLLDLKDVALRLLRLRRTPTRTYARRYLYPREGMGHLYRAVAEDVKAHGGSVRTGVRVVGIETAGQRVSRLHLESSQGPESIAVGEMLSTMPLPTLVRLLRRDAPAEIERAADALRFRALTFVNMMLARSDFSENTWMYVASGALTTSRIQEPKRRSRWMAPEGRTSLMLEVPCDVGDRTWTAGAEELRARGVSELASLGFRVDDVLDAFCVRVAHGYPVYHLRYEADRRLLLREVDRFANVRTAGRQGLFRYVFMDAAMRMGIVAAEQMLTGRQDARALDAIGRSTRVVETTALTA
ncbi:MAG TPA: FAD-dependent oxidoreductase [Polyangiaceae bacterium]|nr:FAD-dependent oxidoreductase [Polyangiaceae bacterium]